MAVDIQEKKEHIEKHGRFITRMPGFFEKTFWAVMFGWISYMIQSTILVYRLSWDAVKKNNAAGYDFDEERQRVLSEDIGIAFMTTAIDLEARAMFDMTYGFWYLVTVHRSLLFGSNGFQLLMDARWTISRIKQLTDRVIANLLDSRGMAQL